MKSIKHKISLFLALAMPIQTSAQIIGIMSFNIRYNNPGDGINRWEERKSELVDLVDYYHPDFPGLQSATAILTIKEKVKIYLRSLTGICSIKKLPST